MDEDAVHIHGGILLSHELENPAIRDDVGGPRGHYAT